MLGPEECDLGRDCRLGPAAVEELLHLRPCVREQRVVDELDGRRRALDVQQDGAQRDSGTYVGPKQTG